MTAPFSFGWRKPPDPIELRVVRTPEPFVLSWRSPDLTVAIPLVDGSADYTVEIDLDGGVV